MNKDFSKVSADGSGAFMDLTLTRLAVFDGRVDAAKKYIGAAEKALSRAKTDETRFLRDEARLNATKNTPMSNNGATPPTADQQSSSNNNQQNSANNQQNASNVEWLPVDASITIDEDFTASPEKKAAVADADKSLGKGDRNAAINKLKLSGVNIDVTVLAVPLHDTIAKVQQAANMINDGKYYEASQLIKQVQDSARSDVMDFEGMPMNRAQNQGAMQDQ
ncbi:MAG: YfdX family protein [Methylocystis sp.]